MLSESKISHSSFSSDKKLIGLAGPARSGKDTAATFLVAQGVNQYYFAKPLYEALSVMLGMSVADLKRRKEETIYPFGKTIRYMLQTLGTEWARTLVHPDYWVMLADSFFHRSEQSVVISDVRFENEANWIRQLGGMVFHLDRADRSVIDNAEHQSENGVKVGEMDIVIDNNSSVDDLYRRLSDARKHYDWLRSYGDI